MKTNTRQADNTLQAFVKDIVVLEDGRSQKLPFYADGFPGLIFMQASAGAILLPKNKRLSDFFLYGQTIKPIEVVTGGAFKLIVFQLYPFASRILFGVNPRKLNDDCFDIQLFDPIKAKAYLKKLQSAHRTESQIKIITRFLTEVIADAVKKTDLRLQLAINLILESKGTITVKELTEQLHTTERTLQRQFSEYVGISPKQFAKIIQFQFSLDQISKDSSKRLTKIVYENGYADHSHFIRDFRKYAGRTPKTLKTKK